MSQAIDFGIPISKDPKPCFISYTREDAPRIASIVKELHRKGLSIWYDQALVYSQDWKKQIAEKIHACCYVIAFFSNETLSKEDSYSVDECRLAADMYEKKVFYVLLEPIDPTKVRYEYALWWSKISALHLITVEKNQTPTQVANEIHRAIKSTSGDTETKKKSDDSAAIVLALFLVIGMCLALVLSETNTLETSDTDQSSGTQVVVASSEISGDSNLASNTESDNMITIFGGIHAPAEDFIFPYSSTELLTEEEMNAAFGLSDSEAMRMNSQAAINEIFARYGFTFTSYRDTGIAAREKFTPLDWYQEVQEICPSPVSEEIESDYMNDIEKENINRILSWREKNNISYY